MQKRGQVSIFAIVGVILVILVALFFFARNEYGVFVEPTTFLGERSKPIEDNLKTCVNDIISGSLDVFGKQGGDFSPSNFRLYEGFNVKYFCTDIGSVPECMNVMPTLSDIATELNEKLSSELNNCLDPDLVESGLGYEIKTGELSSEISLAAGGFIARADYDVELIKGESKTSIKPVVIKFDIPLEEIYSVAVDIVNAEARTGSFEQLLYMLNEKGQYIINLDKPYPNKIYKINKKNDDFELWFAVQGERGV